VWWGTWRTWRAVEGREEEADDEAEGIVEWAEVGWEWDADGWDRGGGGTVTGEGAGLFEGSRRGIEGGGGGELA
jgi:hypothetical protein